MAKPLKQRERERANQEETEGCEGLQRQEEGQQWPTYYITSSEFINHFLQSGGGGGNLDAPIQAAAVVKKGDPKNLKTGKVIPTGDVEKDFMFDEEKGESKASYPKAKGGGKALEMGLSKKTGKVLPDGPAGPGELLAAKNTEAGFKQRKVNKRMKDYEEVEEKDDGGGKGKKDS